ncbi:hypothetical protein QJS10_CPA08g00131 [Acorus calamus]|uniref:Uncharacterized protein n=1 Tax=Acorus calamus TaxID=4465 RepID=A0AAV9E9B7_ACOCL|nr:hypothetical protein QJS10_CPA08g00131 [Acorus calamus]
MCNCIHGRKQSYPEKILTRSHGKKSIKKFNNSIGQTKRPESQKSTVNDDVRNYYYLAKDWEDFHSFQEEFDEIYVEIIDYIVELMTDPIESL